MPANGSHAHVEIGGTGFGEYGHICGFFHSRDEEYRVLLPFIKAGFERGDKAFHVVDPRLREDHLRRLGSADIDLSRAKETGQLELCVWEDVYLPDGAFDQDKMLARWGTVFEKAEQLGFPRTRLVAHMEWALEDRKGVSDLLEYESRLNRIDRRGAAVVCTYDLTRFGGDAVVDVMRTHPMVIMGGVLQENPFFVPPEQFVKELRARDAARA